MRLILTSSGISAPIAERLRSLAGPLDNIDAAVITSTTPGESAWVYVEAARDELTGAGCRKDRIDIIALEKPFPSSAFDKYGLLYICGGNTYEILTKIRKTSFDTAIRRFVKRDGIYLGVSAGSIIAGLDITVAGWGVDGDPNYVGLKDTTGFGFCDIAIFPHYTPANKDDVTSLREKVDYEVVELSDGAALFLWDGGRELVR